MLEHIIDSNIRAHLDRHKILTDAQHGFRQKKSCETQLITTIRDFAESINDKDQTDAILLDFSKAFDKVDHKLLLSKLSSYGISNSLLAWLKSFLSNREQTVIVDGSESSPVPVLSRVPQGTVLGPLLFLVYINDIAKDLSHGTHLRLFADDSLLYRVIKSPDDSATLQRDLDSLQRWETTNKMEFHPQKCELLRITNNKRKIVSQYTIHSVPLSESQSSKYLGVTIDPKLTWADHQSRIINKANSTLSFLRRNTSACPPKVKNTVYKTFVRPILEYGSVVWDPHQQTKISEIEKF